MTLLVQLCSLCWWMGRFNCCIYYGGYGLENLIRWNSKQFQDIISISSARVFILWLGWFGFNGGSVLVCDPELNFFTLVTTLLAAAAGGMLASFRTFFTKTLTLTMFYERNVLGGLVEYYCGC